MMEIIFLVYLLTAASCALLTATAAREKGYNESNWGIAGFLRGPLGLIGMAARPDLRSRKLLRLIAERQGASVEKLSEIDNPPSPPIGEGGALGDFVGSIVGSDKK